MPDKTALVIREREGDIVVKCGNRRALVSLDLNEHATVWRIFYGDEDSPSDMRRDKEEAIAVASDWVVKDD